MGKIRVRHSAECKAKVVLEALEGLKTVNELAGRISDTRCRLANGSGRFKGERKNCLVAVMGRATMRPKPFKRNCTKKSVA